MSDCSDRLSQPLSEDSSGGAEGKEFYQKVLEWRICEKEEEEEDSDSAYDSSGRSLLQSELSSFSNSTEVSKEKVPPLHLEPGENYDCSIFSILSPLSFLLRRNEEEFHKLTRSEISCQSCD